MGQCRFLLAFFTAIPTIAGFLTIMHHFLLMSAGLLLCIGPCNAADAAKSSPLAKMPGYVNLALNKKDDKGDFKPHPIASSNSECRHDLAFAAMNAIDGKTENKGHGGAFPSWGPEQRKDLWFQIDFGKQVQVDRIDLFIRADFPHDTHWHDATVLFSDGTSEKIQIQKTAERQTFVLKQPHSLIWLRFTDLVQDEPLGWAAWSEVEVYGTEPPAKPR